MHAVPITEKCKVASPEDIKVKGSWTPLDFAQSAGWTRETTVSVSTSTTTGSGDTRTSSKQWSRSVEKSIATELTIGDAKEFGASSKTTFGYKVTGASAKTASQSFQRTMSIFRGETEQDKTTVRFDRPGAIWQWKYEIEDQCGTSTVSTTHMVITNNGAEPPCCPLGMSKDPANQRGACVKPEYCICSPSTCKALLAATTPTETDTVSPIPGDSGTQHDSFVLTSFLILFYVTTMTVWTGSPRQLCVWLWLWLLLNMEGIWRQCVIHVLFWLHFCVFLCFRYRTEYTVVYYLKNRFIGIYTSCIVNKFSVRNMYVKDLFTVYCTHFYRYYCILSYIYWVLLYNIQVPVLV